MRFWILLAAFVTSAASAAELHTADEIRTCVRANFPSTTSVQTIEVQSADRGGGTRTLQARAYWKKGADGRARIMLQVQNPPDLAGSSYLVAENSDRDDMFMFLPATNRVKRIQGASVSGALWGTDFSYEDIKQVQGLLINGSIKRDTDTDVGGQKAYVLSIVPVQTQDSGYIRIMSYIDQSTCVPLKTEFFEKGDALRKRLLVDAAKVSKEGAHWVAHTYEMSDLREQTKTVLRIDKVVHDQPLPDRIFNQQTFYLGN